MDYEQQKVDEAALALLFLTTFQDGPGYRAWKSLDWDTMDRLHAQGWIGDPKNKAKSVVLTDEGVARSAELFQKLFGTPEAR